MPGTTGIVGDLLDQLSKDGIASAPTISAPAAPTDFHSALIGVLPPVELPLDPEVEYILPGSIPTSPAATPVAAQSIPTIFQVPAPSVKRSTRISSRKRKGNIIL